MDRIRSHDRTSRIAAELGISPEIAAARLAEAHAKLGFRVIPAARQTTVTRRFVNGVEIDTRFPATIQVA